MPKHDGSDKSVEEPLLRASINSYSTESKGTARAKAHWGKLRMSRKFGQALKSASENTKAMEEGVKRQHMLLTPGQIDEATLYILDSFEGMGMTHGVSHKDLLIHKTLYDSWFEVWYIVSICFYLLEGLVPHSILDDYMLTTILLEVLFISTFTYDIYLHSVIETDDNDTYTARKAREYEEEQAKAKLEQDEELMRTFSAVFQSFDKDHDGTISRAELMTALPSLGISSSKLMESIDIDGDGRIDSVEFEGLCKSVLNTRSEDTDVDGSAYAFSNERDSRRCFCLKLPSKWTLYRGFLVFLQILDLLFFAISFGASVRFSRFTRPLILVLRVQKLRVVLIGVLVAGMKIARVLFLIACDILFFGFLGFVLFNKVEESKGFETPFDGMRTMLLVLTAPGTVLSDMEPLQRHSSGWASFYFIIFVVATSMIFQKLILANAYRSYKGYQKQQYLKRLQNSKRAGTAAFEVLSGGLKAVHKDTWRLVFADLRGAEHPMVADTVFHTCDIEYSLVPGNDSIELEAFLELIRMTKHTGTALKHLELHEEHELTKFENLQKRMRSWFSKKANIYFMEIEVIHTFIDILVLLSIAQLYVSVTYPEDTTWVLIGLLILGCFTVEVVVKMTAFGPKKYLSYGEHILDAFCVGAGIIFFVYESVSNSDGGTLYNIALALRTLRVLKFLWLSETLHGLLWTIIRLGDSLVKLFFILFVPLYMFATVAQQLFGSAITVDGSEAAKGTKWYPLRSELNFETGTNSMRTLFEITTVSSWNMVMEAADILYGNKQYTFWVELFFFSFRIIMTMMFVPILTGFLIESFVTSFDTFEKHHRQKNGTEEDISKQHEMELRLLKTNSETAKAASENQRKFHPKHQVVRKILEERHTMANTEKKIYGVDAQLKDALITSLRKRKNSLIQKLDLKDAALMRQQRKLMSVSRDSRRLTQINSTLRHEMKKRLENSEKGTTEVNVEIENLVQDIIHSEQVPDSPPMPPKV